MIGSTLSIMLSRIPTYIFFSFQENVPIHIPSTRKTINTVFNALPCRIDYFYEKKKIVAIGGRIYTFNIFADLLRPH